MSLDTLLSTIILVTFLVTILLGVASYAAYKLREARRPAPATSSDAPADDGTPYFFERILADDDGGRDDA